MSNEEEFFYNLFGFDTYLDWRIEFYLLDNLDNFCFLDDTDKEEEIK